MRIQKSIEINAPPEKVWSFFVDPDKVLQWYITFKRFEYTGSQRSGVGTPLYIEEQAAGLAMKMHVEVTEWEEHETLGLRMVSGAPLRSYEQRWSLEPTPLGSRFTFAEEIVFPLGVIGRLIGFIAQGVSRANVDKMQAKLKSLAEA